MSVYVTYGGPMSVYVRRQRSRLERWARMVRRNRSARDTVRRNAVPLEQLDPDRRRP